MCKKKNNNMSLLRRENIPIFNKSCSRLESTKDTFGPLLEICLKNFVTNDLENKTRCALSHKLKKTMDIYEKYNGSTNIFPAICLGCLAYKFGLIEKSFADPMLGCSVLSLDNLHSVFVEGPYLCTLFKPKCEVVFPKDTVILPCGYWVFDILLTNRSNLFRDVNKMPKVRFRGTEYLMNKYMFDYFRSIHEFVSKHKNHQITNIFGRDSDINILGLFELDGLLMCGLVQPGASQSHYLKKKSVLPLKQKVLDTKHYYSVDNVTLPDGTKPLVEDFTSFLTNYLEHRLETLESMFNNIANVTGKQIASYCIPNIITDEKLVIYRQMEFNVTWVEKIGLVAIRDIYPEEMLVIDASLNFIDFKNLKITLKKINDD